MVSLIGISTQPILKCTEAQKMKYRNSSGNDQIKEKPNLLSFISKVKLISNYKFRRDS